MVNINSHLEVKHLKDCYKAIITIELKQEKWWWTRMQVSIDQYSS